MNRNIFFLLAALLTLTACEDTVKTPDGKIPNEFLAIANEYMGQFSGDIRNTENTLVLSLNNNLVTLSAQKDIIASECESKIGKLESFSYEEKNGAIEIVSAKFSFDPNRCMPSFIGNNIYLFFKSKNDFKISILEDYDQELTCQNSITKNATNSAPPPYSPPNCRWESVPRYLNGKFSR